ncbi:hypothetical protein [Nocardia sp. NPDC052112]|uniref:hypothetical protein n=1 Tax=Nocardia sp. NPDC052112 TaxID=3155646 RepID=UPI0034330497
MMKILFLCAVVNVVAIFQVRHLSKAMRSGSDWIANRLGLAAQGSSSPGHGGGGGGRALGMGNANVNNSMSPLGVLAAATTINSSPITGWVAGRNSPLSRWSWLDQLEKRNKARGLATEDLRAAAHATAFDRVWLATVARDGIARARRTRRGRTREAAFAANNVAHATGLTTGIYHGLLMAGMSEREARLAADVEVDIIRHADRESLASGHLSRVLAAHKHFERDAIRNPGERNAMARLHGLEASVDRYRGEYSGGVQISDRLHRLGYEYLRNPEEAFIGSLQTAASGPATGGSLTLPGGRMEPVTANEADRLRQWLSNEHALRIQAATIWVAEDPTDLQRIRVLRSEIDRAAMTDQLQAGRSITGAVSLAQPDIVRTRLPQPNPTDPHEHIPLDHLRAVRFRHR